MTRVLEMTRQRRCFGFKPRVSLLRLDSFFRFEDQSSCSAAKCHRIARELPNPKLNVLFLRAYNVQRKVKLRERGCHPNNFLPRMDASLLAVRHAFRTLQAVNGGNDLLYAE